MTPMDSDPVLDAYPPASDAAREALLRFVREAPLAFGAWRGLKGLYKRAEADSDADPTLLGTLLGRLDVAPLAERQTGPVVADTGFQGVVGVAVRGRTAYVLGNEGYGWGVADHLGVLDLDVADPLKPKRLSSQSLGSATYIALCGPEVCVLTGRGPSSPRTLHVWSPDANDPARVAQRGQLALGGLAKIACAYPYVYAAVQARQQNGFSGLRVLRVSDGETPAVVGEVDIPGAAEVAVSEERALACVAAPRVGFRWGSLPRPGGLRVLSIADPARPQIVGSLDLGDIRSLTIAGAFAYVGVPQGGANDPAGVHVIDLSDPRRPRKAGFCPTDGRPATALTVHGGYAYVGVEYNALLVIDVRDPAAPKVVARETVYQTTQVAVDEVSRHAYVATHYGSLEVWNVSHPERPVRAGTPPSAETMGYMKRRARRFLRTLAKNDPDRYARVAFETLVASGRGTAEVNRRRQWVSMDVLFGGSGRYAQTRHGRGSYVDRGGAARRLRLRTREERAPEAWDRHPDFAAKLLTTSDLPWQTHEAAVKMLRARKAALPPVDSAVLGRFLTSPSPLLRATAARQVVGLLEADARIDPVIAADAYLFAGAWMRRRMQAVIARSAASQAAKKRFAERLFQTATGERADTGLSRRQTGALVLLAREFPGTIQIRHLVPFAAALLATGQPDLEEWVLRAARLSDPPLVRSWLEALEPVPAARREAALNALAEAMRGKDVPLAHAQSLIDSASGFVREAAWRLLAASATTEATLRALWLSLLDSVTETPAVRTAMSSPDALALLSCSGIRADEIAARLKDRAFLVGLLSPQTFTTITQTVPASVTLRLIAAAPDEQWARLRGSWLRNLREGVGLTDLWTSAEAALADDVDDRLTRRLLEDADVAETVLGVEEAEALLVIRDPAFGSLLGGYVRAHADRFRRDSPLLLDAATHVLPEVRGWALARVADLGMDLPFALRLMESEVPPSVTTGKTFFEAVPAGSDREFDHALALCDSPQKAVRAYGRAYVTARWETLPRPDLYRALFENPDPAMQAFVAALLEGEAEPPAETAGFDRDVLRAPNRGRGAKEKVKARQAAEPTLDTETLLAMARSRTPRDAEWALGQLAKRALAGQQVEGVSVDGVAGV